MDPDAPSVTVWQLEGEEYVEAAHASGTEQVEVDAPYPLTISPADLVD